MICEGLLPSHIRPIRTSPSSDNSPADAHTIRQEFTIASCLTVYHRAAQGRVRSGDNSWQLQLDTAIFVRKC